MSRRRIRRIPVSHCLKCGKRLNALGGVEREDPPMEGDLTVCICGAVMALTAELTVRALTKPEIRDLNLNHQRLVELAAAVSALQAARASRN